MLAIANYSGSLACATHAHKIFYATQGILLLSNKQSAKVICKFDRLRTAHSKSKKAIWVMENLLATHTFDYIVFRINPGLTSCKDFATVVDNCLDNNKRL